MMIMRMGGRISTQLCDLSRMNVSTVSLKRTNLCPVPGIFSYRSIG